MRKVSQTVQFVGAHEGGMDEILAHFGLTIAISQNTSARDHGATAARAVRRAQRQHQNQNDEEYAACWKNAKNRQH